MRAEGERYSSCWVKQTWEYFILITELRVLPFLCAWNWSGSLGGSLGGSIRNESGGRKVQQLLGQTDMGIVHFDNKIEGLTILVCLELERFLGGSLAVIEMREEGERYSSCWVKQTWEYFILTTELRVLPFLCAWNWSGSLGGSLGGSILK